MSAERTAFPGRWLPVVEAAHALRVSERTLRRQIQHGRHQTQSGERGTEVWVSAPPTPLGVPGSGAGHVPGGEDPVPGAARHVPDLEGQAVDALVELLRDERERAGAVEQAAAMWQERARNLEAENGRLQELLALPAHEEDERSTAAGEPHWWQRLRKRK